MSNGGSVDCKIPGMHGMGRDHACVKCGGEIAVGLSAPGDASIDYVFLQPGPWAEAVRARALESASKCRSASAPPPRIAYCIGGAARSFATPLVLTLLRHNLITALGGSNESRLFLQLKVGDSDKLGMSSTASFMKHNESTTANLAAALDVKAPWLGSLVGEAMLIDGNGAPAEPEGTSRQELVVAPNAEVWSQYRARSCSVNVTVNATVQPCCNREPYLDQANNEERLLLHHLSLLWCRGAIERYEAAAGVAFDLVVFSRPDLVWGSQLFRGARGRRREACSRVRTPGATWHTSHRACTWRCFSR